MMQLDQRAMALPAPRPGRLLIWVLGMLVVLQLHRPDGAAGEATYLAATVGASLFACVAAARKPVDERRTAWMLAAGIAASAVADVLFLVVTQVNGTEPAASVADVFWVASYVFLIGAIVTRPLGALRRASIDADEVIDLVSVSVLLMLVTIHVVDFDALLNDTSVPPGVRILWASYPVLDAVLLAALLRAVFAGRHRGRAGLALFAGVALWLLSDFAYLVGSSAASSAWLDVGWMVGSWGIALAIVPTARPGRVAPADPGLVSLPRIALTLAPMIVPSMLDLVLAEQGGARHSEMLTAATAILLGCALIRSVRLVRVRDEQRERLVTQERYYRVLADNASDAIAVVDPAGRLLRPAPHLASMLGVDADLASPPHGRVNLFDLVPALERHRVRRFVDRLVAQPGTRCEVELRASSDDAPRWLELRGVDLRHDPAVDGILINVVDATRRKAAELELTHLAFHDPLTRLPNRALFQDRLEHALLRTSGSGRSIAVLFLDLDGFKAVNDRCGHAAGDDVLTLVAERLVRAIRAEDTAARIGGDEFAILVEGCSDARGVAVATAERVIATLGEPVRMGVRDLGLAASIGIAVSTPGCTATTLLSDADAAMYRSKADGKARATVYDGELSATIARHRQLEIDIVRAAVEDQLHLEYQTVVELATDDAVGVEALARWRHPTHGAVSPVTFIPLAEATGAIDELGRWILADACRTFAAWNAGAGTDRGFLSVNLSAHQLAGRRIVDTITSIVTDAGLDPERLVLEVTETALIEDPDAVADRLRRLRDHGIRLAIDDFGTGYSSLSYLRQFPFDILKIDRSFVETITETHPQPAILLGLLEFGRRLGMQVVAEGIETETQLRTLREHGCEFGQGYLFSRPEPASVALTQLRRGVAARVTN